PLRPRAPAAPTGGPHGERSGRSEAVGRPAGRPGFPAAGRPGPSAAVTGVGRPREGPSTGLAPHGGERCWTGSPTPRSAGVGGGSTGPGVPVPGRALLRAVRVRRPCARRPPAGGRGRA